MLYGIGFFITLSEDMKYLIVGLGNIGNEYRDTRHNIGFMVAERLAHDYDVTLELGRHAYTGLIKYKGRQLHLILPTTYMNLSGKAVRYHLEKHKIPKENMLVITDDIALDFGVMRMKGKGSDGGHNGLKDIQAVLGTAQYPRLRMGVGNNFHKGQQADYVLSPFTEEEFEQLPDLIEKAAKGVLSFSTVGLERTMNGVNKKPKKKTPPKPEPETPEPPRET